MKKVFSLLALVAAFTFALNNANAQESFGNAGIEIAIPVGDWAKDVYGIGIGGSGGYEFGISDNFAVNANVGITFFSLDDAVSDVLNSAFAIPIQLGGRYYFAQTREGLFAEAQAGVHIFSISSKDIDFGPPIGTIEGESNSETYLSVAPSLGYFVNENISLALKYQLFFISEDADAGQESETGSFIGLKAAYNF